jgi:aminodeoxyfutalosine synthase
MNMKTIESKALSGVRLSDEDALWLYDYAPLDQLGILANKINLAKNGRAVFYNVNRHINPTNICALSCKFCAYSKKIGEEGGYAYNIDEMVQKAGEAISQGATELHMVGGLHPRWGFDRYVQMIAAMRQAFPDVHLKAFTAVELDWMARKARKSIEEIICELRAAGLNSFPGGGAEIFHPEVRDRICDTKVSGEQWIDTHRTAHRLGMRSNCTMLYGHIEKYVHRVDHMRRLRELQDETKGFNVFIPLAFQPFQNEMGINRYTAGADDLRTIAIARLYLDNFKHIKSYWVMLGQDIAQLALHFGANDLDGTVIEEKISKAAGGRSGMIMTRANLESLITRSGRIPVERTTLYEPVRASDAASQVAVFHDNSELAESLIRRIMDEDACLTPHEIWQLATESSPTQLLESVSTLRTRLPFSKSDPQKSLMIDPNGEDHLQTTGDSPSQVVIDIRELAGDLAQVCERIRDLCHSSSWRSTSTEVVILGLKHLARLAAETSQPLTATIAELRQAGVIRAIEYANELMQGQDILGRSYVISTIDADMPLTLCLEFSTKNSSPDWSSFAEQLAWIRSNFQMFASGLTVRLVSSRSLTHILPAEYMHAIALVRLVLGHATTIETPPSEIPSLAPHHGLGASSDQHPVTKLVSTVQTFGSSGLGAVETNRFNFARILEDSMGDFARLGDVT